MLNGVKQMKTKRKMSRYALARRLQHIALQIASGKPIRIGSGLASLPEQFLVEEEYENSNGTIEIEIEIYWPNPSGRPLTSKEQHATSRTYVSGKKQ